MNENKWSNQKKKCRCCKKIKPRTSFRMIGFAPSLFNVSKWCKGCEERWDLYIENSNRLSRLVQTIMRGGRTQTMIGYNSKNVRRKNGINQKNN